uniref:Ankyrin repeat domain 10a n=1 Tax=Sinocyclocheilus grahami TaxID=75366 RepID=A0A672PJG2_SINGR
MFFINRSKFTAGHANSVRFWPDRNCTQAECKYKSLGRNQALVEGHVTNLLILLYSVTKQLECVTRLVQVGCDVNADIAAFGGHPECLLWLLHTGAEINRQVGPRTLIYNVRIISNDNRICDPFNTIYLSGSDSDLRNANGLTAADLAHAQGFHDCAQLLSNAHNQLNQINGFAHNGTDHSHIQGHSLLNGIANRKIFLDCREPNHMKKARTDGIGEELESMNNSFTVNSFVTNGQCYQSQFNGVETIPDESRMDMCGSLHLNGSPSSCVSHRPAWGAFLPESGEHLRYGHYHGFGDTAEDLEDASSCREHSTIVKVEQHYDQEVLSAVQLFHGS